MQTLERLSSGASGAGSTDHPAPPQPRRRSDAGEIRDYLRELSDGRVVDIRASGPVFGALGPRRGPRHQAMVPALSRSARGILLGLSGVFAVNLIAFFAWWFAPGHRLSWPGFVINSLLLVIVLALPVYFLHTVNRMRRVDTTGPMPDLRVAMVVTKAPSEPWSMVQTTLEAMLDQDFPGGYDVWLADEDPTEEAAEWCARHGVRISTRRGDEHYQRLTWPRRRRCKEGNLAYFYDHYGYAAYDVVSQLDADHVPDRDYLTEMVRPFADSAVGYVAAPSVCDANDGQSWAVIGRPYEEASFHGAQQLGLNAAGTPVCIGSHYAVRTQALRHIGGVGPELAEDFTTSYLLNVAGWRGAYAIDASARGDGPPSFAAMVTQEFQWSRSLTKALMHLVLRTWTRLPALLGLRFILQSGVYVLLSLVFIGGIVLFSTASLTRTPWVSVNIVVFFALWLVMSMWLLLVAFMLRNAGLIRPADSPIVSWQRALYAGSRFPFILLGVGAAIWEAIVPRAIDFKVTPKGEVGPQPFPVRLVLPFAIVACVLAGSASVGLGSVPVIGYVGLSLLTAISQMVLATAVTVLHAVETRRATGISRARAVRLIGAPLLMCLLVGAAVLNVVYLYLIELWAFANDIGLVDAMIPPF